MSKRCTICGDDDMGKCTPQANCLNIPLEMEMKSKTMNTGNTEFPNVKAQVASCPICGNNILIAATETTFDRPTTREFAKLMEKGYEIKAVTLEEARSTKMYCDHKPPFQTPSSK